jgi:hypothetical protein
MLTEQLEEGEVTAPSVHRDLSKSPASLMATKALETQQGEGVRETPRQATGCCRELWIERKGLTPGSWDHMGDVVTGGDA